MNLDLDKLKKFDPRRPALMEMGRSFGRILLLSPVDESVRYKKVLSVSIEKGEIAVAVGSKLLSRLKITAVKSYPAPETGFPNPAFLTASLDLAVAELGAEKTALYVIIPKAWAVIKTVVYPSTILENLEEVLSYELDRITPFTPESAYYDYRVMGRENGQVHLLVAAARTDLIDPYLKALREKGYKVEGITINLLGLQTLERYFFKTDQGLIIQIGKDQFEGLFFSAPNTLEVFSDAIKNEPDQIKIERIQKALESLKGLSDGKVPGRETVVYLKDKSPTLKEALKMRMNSAVFFLDEANLELGPLGTDRKQIPFVALGGVLDCLWNKSWKMNVLLKGRHPTTKPPWLMTLCLILVLGILLGVYWMTPIDIETKRLHYLEKQIASKKAGVKKVEALKKELEQVSGEINLINDFKQTKPLSLKILKEITALFPKSAWLTRMRIFENQITIEGYAPSATSLIPKLEGSSFFKKVEYAAPTFKDPRQNMDRFQIKMELKSP